MTTVIQVRLRNPDTGERETMSIAAIGCYVYDVTDQPGTLGRQLCYGLDHTGHTLMVRDGIDEASLRAIIHRE